MKRTTQILAGFSLLAFLFAVLIPVHVHAHGGIGGYHASYARAGGVSAGGFTATGFHAGAVGGVGHVGYYPHYHPGVGYYHPAARAAAWGAGYGAYGYPGPGWAGYGYGDGAQSPPNSVDTTSSQLEGITGFGDSQAGQNTQQQLESDLKKDNDK